MSAKPMPKRKSIASPAHSHKPHLLAHVRQAVANEEIQRHRHLVRAHHRGQGTQGSGHTTACRHVATLTAQWKRSIFMRSDTDHQIEMRNSDDKERRFFCPITAALAQRRGDDADTPTSFNTGDNRHMGCGTGVQVCGHSDITMHTSPGIQRRGDGAATLLVQHGVTTTS
eukprot:1141834-Pelagomonas_calceolata.AAC.8